jgi:hypothetical protein
MSVMIFGGTGSLGLLDLNFQSGYGYTVDAAIVGSEGTCATAKESDSVILKNRASTRAVTQSFQERFGDAYLTEDRSWIRGLLNGGPEGPTHGTDTQPRRWPKPASPQQNSTNPLRCV